MKNWNWDETRIAHADGTGTYEEGFYVADQAAYDCGTEPVAGPFKTYGEAMRRRMEIDSEQEDVK